MYFERLRNRTRSDMDIARMLMGICIFVYLAAFGTVLYLGLQNGASVEHMMALDRGDTADPTEYVHLAHNILEKGAFFISEEVGPEFLRTPGYPLFLAAVWTLFKTFTILPLIQLVLTALTVALIYLIGAKFFPRPVAMAAALIYMIDPLVMYAAWTPISESLFMFFFMSSIYILGRAMRHSWLPYVAAGTLLAAAIYVRPVGLYLTPIVACMAFAHSSTSRLAVRNAGIFLLTVALFITPWMARNYVLSGHFAFSSGSAFNLYFVNLSTFLQAKTGVNYQEIFRQNNNHYFGGIQEEDILRSFKYADQQGAIAREIILAHPFQYALFHTLKSMQLFVGSSIVNVKYHMHQFGILQGERPQGEGAWGMILQGRYRDAVVQTFTHLPRLVERLFWLALYALMLFATIAAIVRRRPNASWIAVAFILIHAVAFMTGPSSDDTRYRLLLEPFLLLLGGFGLYTILPKMRALVQLLSR